MTYRPLLPAGVFSYYPCDVSSTAACGGGVRLLDQGRAADAATMTARPLPGQRQETWAAVFWPLLAWLLIERSGEFRAIKITPTLINHAGLHKRPGGQPETILIQTEVRPEEKRGGGVIN